jgi:D-alanyl-D-alanine carboxypeptidase
MAPALSRSAHRDAYRVAARFYSAAGQTARAITATEAALHLAPPPPDDRSQPEPSASRFQEQAILLGLLADLRYGANGRRGKPPVNEYLGAERARQRIPGLSVGVVRDGKPVLAQGYGFANVERAVPAGKETVYGIASMTKSFTATAIMMLVEEGKITVEDSLSRHLPDAPAAWKQITLRHLLTHTSGIPDLGGPSPGAIIQEASGRPLDFQPGEKWSYSNTGYTILGRIIEKLTGKPLEQFLDERIFRPLQMNFTAKDFTDLNLLSTGYDWQDGKLLKINAADRYGPRQFDRRPAFGHGGFVSTVMDLVKWDAALDTEKLLKRSTLEQMWTPARLNDGAPAPAWGGGYGFGWMVSGDPGHKEVAHGGNTVGVSSVMMRFLGDRLTVIVLSNRNRVDQFGLAEGLVGGFFIRATMSGLCAAWRRGPWHASGRWGRG